MGSAIDRGRLHGKSGRKDREFRERCVRSARKKNEMRAPRCATEPRARSGHPLRNHSIHSIHSFLDTRHRAPIPPSPAAVTAPKPVSLLSAAVAPCCVRAERTYVYAHTDRHSTRTSVSMLRSTTKRVEWCVACTATTPLSGINDVASGHEEITPKSAPWAFELDAPL